MNTNFIRFLFLLLLASLWASCFSSKEKNVASASSDTLAVIAEPDLIPEGTAYDPKSNLVFVSSMYKRKIIAIKLDGSYNDFAETGTNNLWSVFGMEVDSLRNKLWAVSTKGKSIPTTPSILDDRWQSRLYCFDLSSSKLIQTYDVNSNVSEDIGFNDLTVAKNGDVYITESVNNKIYYLKFGSSIIEEFLKPNGFTFLNGITLSQDNKILFVSCTEGLLKIDATTKVYSVLQNEFTVVPQAIDGLAFYKNSLIGHQGSLIRRFYLNESLDSIVQQEVIDDRDLNSSTTGEIGENGWYYYIANSQIRTGVDYVNKRIKSLDSLDEVVIKRKKIQY